MHICKGCCCNFPDGSSGLVSGNVHHSLTKDSPLNAEAQASFVRFDSVFREYFAYVRAKLLVHKVGCCDPPTVPWAKSPGAFKQNLASDLDFIYKGCPVGTCMSKDGVAYREAQKWKKMNQLLCKGEKLPEPEEDKPASGKTKPRTVAPEWDDKTDFYLLKHPNALPPFEQSCKSKQYAYLQKGGEFFQMLADRAMQYLGVNRNEILSHHWMQLLQRRPELRDRIICTDDGYAEQASAAFVPIMGTKWLPPDISQKNEKGKGLEFQLTCGGSKLHLDIYGGMENSGGRVHKGRTKASKAPDGTDVTGKLGAFKMDGGYVKEWNKAWYKKHRKRFAKAYRRRHASGRLDWLDYHSMVRLVGYYRNDFSQEILTCCPTKGIPRWRDDGGAFNLGKPKKGDYSIWPEDSGLPCNRGLYGVTKQCKTTLRVKILTRKQCPSCEAEMRTELVKVLISHALEEDSPPGCAPWFTEADAAVRAYLNLYRTEAVRDMVGKCKCK